MAWDSALTDLRTFMCDTDRDGLVKRQELIGPVTGQNRVFMTFSDRLVASGNQSVCGRPMRIWEQNTGGNFAEVAASGILVTDQYLGEIQLMYAPSGIVKMFAAYYHQQLTDEEYNTNLEQAAHLASLSAATAAAEGLQPAVLHFAASFSHQKLANRWQQRKSDQFMYQESPTREAADDRVKFHQEQAKGLLQMAGELRRSYYDLHFDRGRAPSYGILQRNTPSSRGRGWW